MSIRLTIPDSSISVLQNIEEHDKSQEELAFVKAIAQGLRDIKAGQTLPLSEAKARLGIQ